MDKELKKHKLKQKKTTEGNFMHAFAKQIAKEILIKEEDLDRSLRAVDMIKEYIRQEYDKPNSIKSRQRVEKMCLHLLSMEKCSIKSVSDAAGNPTSISLKPISTSALNILCFLPESIGSTRAWFPSRRSTLHQIGALVIVWLGHCLSFMGT